MSALVTGGAGAMGRAAAASLARDGASVVLMGRTEASLAQAAEEVATQGRFGAEVALIVGDAARGEDVQNAVARAGAMRNCRFAMCVATPGGGRKAPLMLLDKQALMDAFELNLITAFHAVKYSAAVMGAAEGGSIVCVSSIAARLSWPYLASYSVSKAGLEALVRVAADELGHLGIRVNAIRPGLSRNANNGAQFEGDAHRRAVSQMPLGRSGVPQDIAAGIRYLAGPESSWVTGQSLAIDGGQELRRASDYEPDTRRIWGDDAVDAAQSGIIPASLE